MSIRKRPKTSEVFFTISESRRVLVGARGVLPFHLLLAETLCEFVYNEQIISQTCCISNNYKYFYKYFTKVLVFCSLSSCNSTLLAILFISFSRRCNFLLFGGGNSRKTSCNEFLIFSTICLT